LFAFFEIPLPVRTGTGNTVSTYRQLVNVHYKIVNYNTVKIHLEKGQGTIGEHVTTVTSSGTGNAPTFFYEIC
jgi:hypothetical protein